MRLPSKHNYTNWKRMGDNFQQQNLSTNNIHNKIGSIPIVEDLQLQLGASPVAPLCVVFHLKQHNKA
ncbi:hypothetical protein Y032_0013g1945 [Ancylostoma ceylanicum]|uniref:Uncharacterized protein n=1 Tax=Ancylostoma ceylanicum TaxID=53326 RepID=A0A016VBY1_9BILA|nr:hypothetical protein Y032_0013g1945 [Ancylostoma ceylanicum]